MIFPCTPGVRQHSLPGQEPLTEQISLRGMDRAFCFFWGPEGVKTSVTQTVKSKHVMSRASDEKKLLYVFLSVTLSKSYYAA